MQQNVGQRRNAERTASGALDMMVNVCAVGRDGRGSRASGEVRIATTFATALKRYAATSL